MNIVHHNEHNKYLSGGWNSIYMFVKSVCVCEPISLACGVGEEADWCRATSLVWLCSGGEHRQFVCFYQHVEMMKIPLL